MELLDKRSILLSLGDLSLDDTAYTFGKPKTINGIKYEPLKKKNSCDHFPDQLASFVHGDYRFGVKITKENNSIYLAYGANSATSRAQNLAIGYKTEVGYYFIKESFQDISSPTPELSGREIITIDSLWNLKKAFYRIVMRYSNATYPLTKKELEEFQKWALQIKKLENAFHQENLDVLSPVRQRRKEVAEN